MVYQIEYEEAQNSKKLPNTTFHSAADSQAQLWVDKYAPAQFMDLISDQVNFFLPPYTPPTLLLDILECSKQTVKFWDGWSLGMNVCLEKKSPNQSQSPKSCQNQWNPTRRMLLFCLYGSFLQVMLEGN